MDSIEKQMEQLKAFHQEAVDGLGAFVVAIVRPRNNGWVAQTEFGLRFVKAFEGWRKLVDAGAGPLCLDCDHKFEPGAPVYAVATIMPAGDAATKMAVIGVCEECARRSDDELKDVVYRRGRVMGMFSWKLDNWMEESER